MDKTTEYNDLDIDQLNEETETELDTEHIETEEVENEDDEVAKLRSENKKLVEIIKRRKEREAQAPQEQKQTITIKQTNNAISREEAILFAQGYTEEDVDHLNLVAKGAGLSLKDAKDHPLFVSYMEKQDMEKKARKASMGTSKGSSAVKKPDLSKLSDDEHKDIWFKTLGINQ